MMHIPTVLATTLQIFAASLKTATPEALAEARTHMAYTKLNHGSAVVQGQMSRRINLIDQELASRVDRNPVVGPYSIESATLSLTA